MTAPVSAPSATSSPYNLAPLAPAPGLAASFAPEADPSQALANDLYQATSFGATPSPLTKVAEDVRKDNGICGLLYKVMDVVLTPFKWVFNKVKAWLGYTPKPEGTTTTPLAVSLPDAQNPQALSS